VVAVRAHELAYALTSLAETQALDRHQEIEHIAPGVAPKATELLAPMVDLEAWCILSVERAT
jgi:hypothetical protein